MNRYKTLATYNSACVQQIKSYIAFMANEAHRTSAAIPRRLLTTQPARPCAALRPRKTRRVRCDVISSFAEPRSLQMSPSRRARMPRSRGTRILPLLVRRRRPETAVACSVSYSGDQSAVRDGSWDLARLNFVIDRSLHNYDDPLW